METKTQQDYAAKIEVGEPGGGGMMTAASLALFYQGLLHNPGTPTRAAELPSTSKSQSRIFQNRIGSPMVKCSGVSTVMTPNGQEKLYCKRRLALHSFTCRKYRNREQELR